VEPGSLILGIDSGWFGFAYGVKHLADETDQLIDFYEAILFGFYLFFICVVERFPVLSQNENWLGSNRRCLIVLNHLRLFFRVRPFRPISKQLCIRHKVNQYLIIDNSLKDLKHLHLCSRLLFFRYFISKLVALERYLFNE
jgi:hypothetical protein